MALAARLDVMVGAPKETALRRMHQGNRLGHQVRGRRDPRPIVTCRDRGRLRRGCHSGTVCHSGQVSS